MMREYDGMLNKKIASIELNKPKDEIYFKFDDGTLQGFGVEGDCCSHSWIEHLETPDNVVGAIILSVDELGIGEIESTEHECLQAYQTVFKTDRGDICLEYRNSSNGYYSGWIYPLKK